MRRECWQVVDLAKQNRLDDEDRCVKLATQLRLHCLLRNRAVVTKKKLLNAIKFGFDQLLYTRKIDHDGAWLTLAIGD